MTPSLCRSPLSILAMAGLSLTAQAAETLTLSASSTTPTVGSQVEITVGVAGASPFAVLGQQLVFDASKLRLDSQTTGTLVTFVADSRAQADINGSAQVRSGYFYLDGSGRGANNAGGTGTVGRFTFTVLAAGSTSVTVPGKSASNPFGAVLINATGAERAPGLPAALTLNLQAPLNQAPTVALTTPAADAVFNAPASVNIAATASDSDGTVAKVEFYNGSTLLGSDTASPYAFTWSNVAAGTYNLSAKATDNAGAVTTSASRSITVQAAGGGSGTILREWWSGVSGTAVSQIPLASVASGTNQPTSFEAPTDWADNYGTRMRGYLFPPTTGTYTFWIAGDDNCELWLSTDSSVGSKRLIASVAGWTNSREWTKLSGQVSAAITLTGGQRYYIEALQKEGGGGDNLAVAWQGPGITQQIIPGQYLSPVNLTNAAPAVALDTPAAGAAFTAPASVTITATASDSDGTVTKVEFYDGTTLLGSDTTSPYAYTWANVAAGTYNLSAKATDNAGSVTTSAARTITVQAAGGAGTGLPAVYYDNGDFTGTSISRTDATVNFDWGTGGPATAIGADTFSVRWSGQVEVPASGSWTFTTTGDDGIRLWVNNVLVIDNWKDQAPTDTSGSITLNAGQRYDLRMEYYENGGGAVAKLAWSGPSQTAQIIPSGRLYPPAAMPTNWVGRDIGSMTPAGSSSYDAASDTFSVTGAGADIWNTVDAYRSVDTDISGSCDLIARVTSLQNSDAWAKAGVMLRNGLSADAQHSMMIISFASGASFQRRLSAGGSSDHTTVAGISAPRWVKLSRRGDVFTGYHSADGLAWTQVGQVTMVLPASLKAALAVTSHNDGTANTATFSNVSLVPVSAN